MKAHFEYWGREYLVMIEGESGTITRAAYVDIDDVPRPAARGFFCASDYNLYRNGQWSEPALMALVAEWELKWKPNRDYNRLTDFDWWTFPYKHSFWNSRTCYHEIQHDLYDDFGKLLKNLEILQMEGFIKLHRHWLVEVPHLQFRAEIEVLVQSVARDR